MSGKLATIYIWITVVISVMSIALMLIFAGPKEEGLANEKQETASQQEKNKAVFYEKDFEIAQNSMQLYLPAFVKQSQLLLENTDGNKGLRISILKQPEQELKLGFFYENPLHSNLMAEELMIEEQEDRFVLAMKLRVATEWEVRFEENEQQNCMYLQMIRPKEKYEKIVVIDPGHGAQEQGYLVKDENGNVVLCERDIAWEIAQKTGKILEKEGIGVYYTREQETNPTAQQRVDFANEMQADMLISIHADYDTQDTSVYGMRTIYNETYFIPEFASADLAYLLLEKVAAETNEKALGFEPCKDNDVLVKNAMIPVAQLNIGYFSNKQEQKLLQRIDYSDRIASGIYDAIMAGYEEIEK